MRRTKVYILCLLMMVSTGCVETIVMDTGEKDLPVVVNCILDFQNGGYTLMPSGGRGLSLTLQYVKGKADPEFIPVEDAVVYLERPAGSNPYLKRIDFVHTEGCTWESDETELKTHIYPNELYILKVEIPGRETIWAETWTQPDIVAFNVYDSGDSIAREIELKGNGLENYCLWAFARERTEPGAKWDQKRMDYLVTDNPNTDDFNVNGNHYSDLSFRGIPKDDLGFAYQMAFEQAKGEFADMPLHEGFIRIGNLDYDKPFFIFPGPLCPPDNIIGISPSISSYSWIDCYIVSSDLDKYLRSAYIHNKSLNSSLAFVYSTANDIYTNIHGGLGVFGSRYVISYAFLSDKIGW